MKEGNITKFTELEYLNQRILDGKRNCIILQNESDQAVKRMLNIVSKENMDILRAINNKLEYQEYTTLFYMDIALLLEQGKTESEIITEFSLRLNQDKRLLKCYEELYKIENKSSPLTLLSSKKKEATQLEMFINNELCK